MFRTVESQLLHQAVTTELKAEFQQYDFERLRTFCVLVLGVGIVLWFLFDLVVSFEGGQGFTFKSIALLAVLVVLAACVPLVRKAWHFYVLNLVYVTLYCVSARLVIAGIPLDLQPLWLTLTASSVVFFASVLPHNNYSFFSAQALTWGLLNPFVGGIPVLELKGTLILFYVLIFASITSYTYVRLRQGKLHNYLMAKLLMEQAYMDALTQIPNRRAFMTRTASRLEASTVDQMRYLAMVDIDYFKKVNDSYGHDIGDEVLQRVAGNIRAVLGDFEFARLGGEEFGVYLWDITPDEVQRRMQLLLATVREAPAAHPVTISIGLGRLDAGDSLNQALIKADQALYDSKHNGRNRCTYAP
ncbi:GGDEF domain-containing protein [Pseudomonas sp. BN414]|uniref:GGDEF domain-containing protein n=1 Tax=Pseudomonas sp. BN414 TaxID=2567888 RepID=UPI002457C9D2|nr:GGDEF domain-containing protein [Pseudomonas sp. BN414]MDH4566862.1 GGDEF domain-containing protein [Pseudomonas sp. BN414]